MESFNLETMEWEDSHEPFPFAVTGFTTNVPYGNSFISVGGYADKRQIHKVSYRQWKLKIDEINIFLQYDPDSRTFHQLPVRLQSGANHPGVLLLDESKIHCTH